MLTHFYLTVATYEKISEARRAAAHDRLVLTADRARREGQRVAGSPLARLLWMLACTFGRGRSVLGTTVPAGRAR